MVVQDEPSPPTDSELIQRFLADPASGAFDQLVHRHSGRAYQIAYGILGNREDSEEVVQDTFLRIFRSLPNFRGDAEFTTWMYRIVVNLCNNKFRWNRRRGQGRTVSIDAPLPNSDGGSLRLDPPDRTPPPDVELANRELRRRAEEAMQRLPESYRTAVLLRNLRHLDYDQIAEILHCAVGTVKSRINRGREILREAIGL